MTEGPATPPPARRYPERVTLDDADEPKPFDAFHRPAPEDRGLGYGNSNRAGQHAAPDPGPYVPEPAVRPLPPGVAQEDSPTRSAGGRLGRSLRPFGRGRTDPAPTGDTSPAAGLPPATDLPPAAEPIPARVDDERPSRRARHGAEPAAAEETAEAEADTRNRRGWRRSKPDLPTPAPADPIPAAAAPEPPAPAADTDPAEATEPVNESKRAARKRKKDEEFVDWVSGLGGGESS
jgi:hypothetical protein